MVSNVDDCRNCNHECHCKSKCEKCSCENCEHNALDEFWKRLANGFDETAHKEPYKTFNIDEGYE